MKWQHLFLAILALVHAPLPATASPAAPDDAEIARRIDAHFAPLARSSDISGTLRIEREGAPVIVRHFGYADWPRKIQHDSQTLYSAASVTKGVVAATLVTLTRDGTLALEDPVSRWLPALSAFPDLTLQAVLEHRAGLPENLPAEFDSSRSSVGEWLASHPDQISRAGEEQYSNVGYALLAEVIEAADGAGFPDVAQRRVLDPAGMEDSLIGVDTADHFPGGALPYTAGPAPSGVMTPLPAPLELGSSGLVTNAADLARWARTLADGAYPELFQGDDPLGSIDAGTDDNGAYVSVQGTLPGYVANAIAWRDSDVVISFTGNLFSYPALDLGDVLRDLLGHAPPTPPTPRPDAVPLTKTHLQLVGEHQHPGFGTVAVKPDPASGELVATLSGKPAYWSFHLTPISEGRLHWRAFNQLLHPDGTWDAGK